MLYADRDQLLSTDAAVVLIGIVFGTVDSFYSFGYLGNGAEIPLIHNAIAFLVFVYLFWAHWRLEFDLVADLFKFELAGVICGFVLTTVAIIAAGNPENAFSVPVVRALLGFTMTASFAAVPGFLFSFYRAFDGSNNIPSPDDF